MAKIIFFIYPSYSEVWRRTNVLRVSSILSKNCRYDELKKIDVSFCRFNRRELRTTESKELALAPILSRADDKKHSLMFFNIL